MNYRKNALKIWKPGTDLKEILSKKGDTSHFGGISEIRYFVDYFGAIPINSANEVTSDDVVLINNCSPDFHKDVIGLKAGKIIQLVSDLNIIIPDDYLGEHMKFCQIPHPLNRAYYYSSIEKSILLYYEPQFNVTKKYSLAYGGGARNGNRDKQFMEYLNPQRSYVSKLVTSSKIFSNSDKVSPKTTFNNLQSIYAQTKYGIVISDPNYYKVGMLTQRYWEYCLNDMVAFIHKDYDKFYEVIKQDDFRRVGDSNELEEKIKYLDMHIEERDKLLLLQRDSLVRERKYMEAENIELLRKLIYDL